MSGVSAFQRWTNIEIPIAFPTVMLGVNQTVVFSLQMVILGALIGTEDLGQIIFGALSRTKDGAGVALTLGIFVSLIAICVDVIVRNWAEERKKALGLAKRMIIPRVTQPYEPGLPALGDDLENYLVTG